MTKEQKLRQYLLEHKRKVSDVLGPIVPPGQIEVREAGLDLMLEDFFNRLLNGRYVAVERTPNSTKGLLRGLRRISTECVTAPPTRYHEEPALTVWDQRIVTPREFDMVSKLYSLDGRPRTLNEVNEVIESNQYPYYVDTAFKQSQLIIASNRVAAIFSSFKYKSELGGYIQFQPGNPMSPQFKMPGTFAAEELRSRFSSPLSQV